jgi:hypothetical protein
MPLLLDVDAHGRVVPHSEDARCALADRAGRFVLLPSAGDLLVARRTPAAGGAAARPRCVLAGDLSAFPIADFIAFIHQSRLSGVLCVVSGSAERSVAFQEGEVRSAHSTAPGERIGEVAVRLGFATEAEVASVSGAGGRTGKALVDRGIVQPNDVWKCLHEQVTAVFHALLLSPSGTFFLMDEDPVEKPSAPLSVSTQSLLMDGIRRIDELSLFRARIPGSSAYLRRREPPRGVALRPTEAALVALVDGRRTVGEIATAAHMNEFDATKILFHLAEAGFVEAVAEPLASSSAADRIPALVAGMNELLRAIAQGIPPGARASFLDAAQGFLWDDTNPYAPLVRTLAVAPDGSLDAAALQVALGTLDRATLAQLAPSGEPAKILFEALREALLFWLFLAGERIGRKADESLTRTVKSKLAQLEGLA